MEKNCKFCKRAFKKGVFTSVRIWHERVNYCSKQCTVAARKGVPTWNKGLKGVQKAWNKGIPAPAGQNSATWKGDKVGYHGLHKWVAKELGKPCKCEFCGTDGLKAQKIHWANKSREYKRITSDWLRLCAKCHLDYDRKI